MGNNAKKELKDLGRKYDEIKGNLEKRIEELQERLKEDPDKELRTELDQVKKELQELKVKIEEMNYIKGGYTFKDGKWIEPEKKDKPKLPGEAEPPTPPKEPEEPEEPKKDKSMFL